MPDVEDQMTPAEFREALRLLRLLYPRERAIEFLDVSDRTIQRWIAGTSLVPRVVAVLL